MWRDTTLIIYWRRGWAPPLKLSRLLSQFWSQCQSQTPCPSLARCTTCWRHWPLTWNQRLQVSHLSFEATALSMAASSWYEYHIDVQPSSLYVALLQECTSCRMSHLSC